VDLGSATLSDGQILGNSAGGGGGVFVQQGRAILSRELVLSNTAASGGGIFNQNGTLTLVNTTVSRNAATSGSGGGLHTVVGSMSALTYTTVASNTAASGGGGIHMAGGTIALKDTIVAHNGAANCGASLTSNGHNLDSDDTCGLTVTTDITSTNPLLGPLTYDLGTWVHPLLGGSPAVDAGECVPAVTTVDQRGVTRPQGVQCDIGAYELIRRKIFVPLVMVNH
jgi:hypothetical protein